MGWKRRFTPKLIVSYIAAVLLLLWARPAWWSLLATIPLYIFGEWIRVWGTGHLRKNEAVITSGPYSHIRDPLYMGTLSILSGFAIAARVYEMLIIIWVLFFVYYMPYKRKREGDRLAQKFGKAYEDYRAEVNSLWPRLKPYRGPDFGTRWSGPLVVENHEIGTGVAVVVFYVVLVAKLVFFPDLIWPPWHLW